MMVEIAPGVALDGASRVDQLRGELLEPVVGDGREALRRFVETAS